MNTTKPAVGDTVHYTDNPVFGGGHARCFEATVTTVNPDGTIDIDEMLPGAVNSVAYALIEQSKPGDLYTWHWPEPTEGERETPELTEHQIAVKEAQHKGWLIGYTEAWNNATNGDLPSHPPLDDAGRPWVEEQVKPAVEEPTEGERETNRLLHHITGGDFL